MRLSGSILQPGKKRGEDFDAVPEILETEVFVRRVLIIVVVRDRQPGRSDDHQHGREQKNCRKLGRNRKGATYPDQIFEQSLSWKPPLSEIDEEGSRRHTEHGHTDRKESKVIIGDNRQNPRFNDLHH